MIPAFKNCQRRRLIRAAPRRRSRRHLPHVRSRSARRRRSRRGVTVERRGQDEHAKRDAAAGKAAEIRRRWRGRTTKMPGSSDRGRCASVTRERAAGADARGSRRGTAEVRPCLRKVRARISRGPARDERCCLWRRRGGPVMPLPTRWARSTAPDAREPRRSSAKRERVRGARRSSVSQDDSATAARSRAGSGPRASRTSRGGAAMVARMIPTRSS